MKIKFHPFEAMSWSPRGQWEPCSDSWEPGFDKRNISALRVSGSAGVVKKQANPEIKMKEHCAIPQQIGQFGNGTVASNRPSGKGLLPLGGVSWIRFTPILFFTDTEMQTCVFSLL